MNKISMYLMMAVFLIVATNSKMVLAQNESFVVQQFKTAISNNNTARVNELIKLGINVNAKDELGKTPLDYAQEAQATEIIALLKSNNAQNGTHSSVGTTSWLELIERGKRAWEQIKSNIPQDVKDRAYQYLNTQQNLNTQQR